MLRYEIPTGIKDIFEKAQKFSKELKKTMSERATLGRLEELQVAAVEDHKIITNEITQFEQSKKE